MKLFVDDQREAPAGWHPARTVTEAIRILSNNYVEVVSLDHDIKGSDETFMAVACFLKTSGENFVNLGGKRPRVYIHTGNWVAAETMRDMLRDSGYIVMFTTAELLNRYEEDLIS